MSAVPERILSAIIAEPWLIDPAHLERILLIAQRQLDDPQLVALRQGVPLTNARTVEVRGTTAVIPVRGPIFRYANLFTEISGATSLEVLAQDFGAALDDPSIESIVLSIDSPGGQASGIAEFAALVRESNKPVVAHVSDMAASAAYWIASAAERVVATPTALLGSIGVVGTYRPERDGAIKIISSQSPLKQADPTTEAGRAEMQRVIDDLADVFIGAVASNRGITRERVLSDFGRGGLLVGAKAVSADMADALGSYESLFAGHPGTTTEANMPGKDGAQAPAMTRERLAVDYPEMLHEIEEDAKTDGYALGLEDGRKEGAQAERDRIKAVLEQSMPGHEALVNMLAFDGVTTAAQAALQVLGAERKMLANARADIREEAPAPVHHAGTEQGGQGVAGEESLPIEERCKAQWQRDAGLRAEFISLDSYIAYKRAEVDGKIKRIGGNRA